MRPRPKNIYQPSLTNVSSLALALAALIFCLCLGNPNYATSVQFSLTYWLAFPFAMCAFFDAVLERFLTPSWKGYSLASFFVAAFEMIFLIVCLASYFVNNQESDAAIVEPRYGAALLLLGIWLVGGALRVFAFTKPEEIKKPLTYERWACLLFSFILLLFSCFLWSVDKSVYTVISVDQVFLYITLAIGAIILAYALYLFASGDKTSEESSVKALAVLFGIAFLAALILVFSVAGTFTLSGSNSQQIRVFYWAIFSMVGYLLSAASACGYYAYVAYRLKN